MIRMRCEKCCQRWNENTKQRCFQKFAGLKNRLAARCIFHITNHTCLKEPSLTQSIILGIFRVQYHLLNTYYAVLGMLHVVLVAYTSNLCARLLVNSKNGEKAEIGYASLVCYVRHDHIWKNVLANLETYISSIYTKHPMHFSQTTTLGENNIFSSWIIEAKISSGCKYF